MHGQMDVDVRGGVAWLILARPAKKNALTEAMWGAIPPLLEDLASRGDVVAVALRGAGGTFGAGADLGDVLAATASREEAVRYCTLVVRALLAVASCPLPTLALLEGVAAGGAAELAIAADMRIAERSASVSFPFARMGIVPDRFTLSRLVALVGPGAAKMLTLTGRSIDGLEARSIGLVDEVARTGEIEARALHWASQLAAGSRAAMASMKQVMWSAEHPVDEGGIGSLIGPMVESFLSGDVRAAALRFLAKPPLT
jgi:enoyl-CoA hydratase/carnithine racemase